MYSSTSTVCKHESVVCVLLYVFNCHDTNVPAFCAHRVKSKTEKEKEKLRAAKRAIEEATLQVTSLTEEHDELEGKIEEHQTELDELYAELALVKKERVELSAKLGLANAKAIDQSTKLADQANKLVMSVPIEAHKAEMDSLTQTTNKNKKKLRTVKADFKKLRTSNAELETAHQQALTVVQELKEAAEMHVGEVAAQRATLSQELKEAAELHENKFAALDSTLHQELKEAAVLHADEVAVLRASLRSLEKSLKRQHKTHKKHVDGSAQSNETMSTSKAKLRKKFDKVEAALRKSNAEIEVVVVVLTV